MGAPAAIRAALARWRARQASQHVADLRLCLDRLTEERQALDIAIDHTTRQLCKAMAEQLRIAGHGAKQQRISPKFPVDRSNA